jgi:uncharacterized protein (TIGR02597 family)
MKLSHFFTVIAFAAAATAVQAQTPINTVPEGITTFNIAATPAAANSSSYFSAPLINDPTYTGAVSATPTTNTITVGDQPPPWTTVTLGAAANPYFVKFLSGLQAGRVCQVLSNTASTLTLDITDNTTQSVALNATNYSVATGDTFEIFAGDTLGLMFGLNTGSSPLVLKGGNRLTADSVTIFVPDQNQLVSYYFDTAANQWEQIGSTVNANNIVIRPYAAFIITRRQNEAATSFVLTGRVAEVEHTVKTLGGNAAVYDSTGYPVDIMLSQLQLGTNWAKATIPAAPAIPNSLVADTVSVWDASANQFDVYFECTDSTWRKVNGGNTDQSSFVIPAATTVCFTKRSIVTGSNSFLQPVLPYSLTK